MHGTTVHDDIAAAGASSPWLARAEDYAPGVSLTRGLAPPPAQAGANAVVAVALARAAVAEAILAVAQARDMDVGDTDRMPARRIAVLRVAPVSGVGRRILDEVRHVVTDKTTCDPGSAGDHSGDQHVAGHLLSRQRMVQIR